MTLGVSGPAAWAERTKNEIRDTATADGSLLVVPIGSVEQHGNHLPVGTDSMLVTAVVEQAILTTRDELPVLVTPTVWTGHSPHHRSFGGTISLDADEFISHISAVADSALNEGFDAILFLNGHGGNIPLVNTAPSTIGPEHPDVEVMSLTYFHLAGEAIERIRDSEPGGMGHGGEFETSLMMHLYPDLVDENQLSGTDLDEPYDLALSDLVHGGPLGIYRPFTAYTESGAIGDPTLATAEKGRKLLDALGDALGDLLGEIHERNRSRG